VNYTPKVGRQSKLLGFFLQKYRLKLSVRERTLTVSLLQIQK
jgi:hypothetical protein